MDKDILIKEIDKLEIDALYGKKKHFNASNRKHRYLRFLGVAVILINVFLGSVFFSFLTTAIPALAKWLGAFAALIAVSLSSLQTFFNLQKQIEGHTRVANKYLSIAKASRRTKAYFLAKTISKAEFAKKIEALANQYEDTNREAVPYNINAKDYNKAQKGFKVGEESYNDDEFRRED